MSEARRTKRENKRADQKYGRQIDWSKIKKTFMSLLGASLIFFAIICAFSFYAISSHNAIRKKLLGNSATITGSVIHISGGKGVHSATYEFECNSQKYTGSTFSSYKGNIGDNICIQYSIATPDVNLFCNDTEMEDWYNDGLLFSLKVLGIMLTVCILLLGLKIITNDKKIIAELTSRKH